MKRKPLIVQHPSELTVLSVWRGLGPQGHAPIRIQAEGLPTKQVEDWERRLNRQVFACGCDRAAIGLAAGVVGYFLWLVLRPAGLASLQLSDLWLGLATVIPTTLAGKVVGLWGAQRELSLTVMKIAREWKAPPRPAPEPFSCG
jgi:hypothetical protein